MLLNATFHLSNLIKVLQILKINRIQLYTVILQWSISSLHLTRILIPIGKR